MRYLAIDLGGKRTGLATGDDALRIASPLDVIEARGNDHLFAQLAGFIEDHEPDELVVGLPLNMDDHEGPAAKRVRAIAEQLAHRFQLPVRLVDERLSSAAANEKMSQSGLTHGQKKARRDALAAAAILQEFLDQH